MAAPMRGPEALNDLDLLDRRGKVARLLGVGQAPAPPAMRRSSSSRR